MTDVFLLAVGFFIFFGALIVGVSWLLEGGLAHWLDERKRRKQL